jgi:hypothetical protein
LSKTAPFHTLFIKKEEEEARNDAVLDDTVGLLLPWMREAGEEDFLTLFSPTPSLS